MNGPRYTAKQLQDFREISKCTKCVHYMGCPFWMAVLLLNGERAGPFHRMMLPDIEKPCIMFAKHPIYWNVTGEPSEQPKVGKRGRINK